MRATHRHILLAMLSVFCLTGTTPLFAQNGGGNKQTLDEAIETMRNTDGDHADETELIFRTLELRQAWDTLIQAGAKGRKRIHKELKYLDKEGIEDDTFKLEVAKALWMGWGFREAKTIAKIWEETPLGKHYTMAFMMTFEAARNQKPAALPMMKALLRHDHGQTILPRRALTLPWPQPLEIVWGVYGPDGRSELLKVMRTTEDEVTMAAALIVLYQSRYLSALPHIREIAHNGPPDAKLWAINILGAYGHPEDREFLLKGLENSDPQAVAIYITALASYEDLSTVPAVLKCLKNENAETRRAAITALGRLCCMDSIKALHNHAKTTKDEDERKACERYIDDVLSLAGIDYKTLAAMPRKEANQLLLDNCPSEKDLRPQSGDRKLTRSEFKKACQDWTKRGCITGGEFAWVESRHIMTVATSKDIKRLLLLRAQVYRHLSSECLEEVKIIDTILHHLSRSRYRKITGLCEKVEPKEKAEKKKEKKKSKKSKKGKKKAKKN